MTRDTNDTTSSGYGLFSVLLLLFIVLKVTATGPVATWSWWWVMSPLWIPMVVFVGFMILTVAVAGVIESVKSIGSWFSRRRKMTKFVD